MWPQSFPILIRTFTSFWASHLAVKHNYGQIYILLGIFIIYFFLDVTNLVLRYSFWSLYFFRFQEVKSQPQNIVMDYILLEDPWTRVFRYKSIKTTHYLICKFVYKRWKIISDIYRDVLKKYDYVKIRSQRLQGLVLNAFCLRKHLTQLRLMEVQYTKTGFGGMWVREQYSNTVIQQYTRNTCFTYNVFLF